MQKEEGFFLYGKYKTLQLPNKKYSKECFPYVASLLFSFSDYAYSFSGIEMKKVFDAVKQKKPSLLEKGKLSIFAKSAYVYYRLKEENIKLLDEEKECNKKEDFNGNGIGVIAIYGDWIMIKKLSQEAKEYEVSALLSSSIEKFIEKYYFYKYNRIAQNNEKLVNLENIVNKIKNANDIKERLRISLSLKNFRPFPFLAGLIKAYPDLKIKKPRGMR